MREDFSRHNSAYARAYGPQYQMKYERSPRISGKIFRANGVSFVLSISTVLVLTLGGRAERVQGSRL